MLAGTIETRANATKPAVCIASSTMSETLTVFLHFPDRSSNETTTTKISNIRLSDAGESA